MPNLTTMFYGSYQFVPVPFITLNQSEISNKDGRIGTKYTLSLDGTLSTAPADSLGGIANVDTLQDNLRAAFAQDGLCFDLKCGDTTLLKCYPKLAGPIVFQPTNNNWVYTTAYTIELEFEDFYSENNAPYVEQASEEWNVEFAQDTSNYNIALSGVSGQVSGLYYSNDVNPTFWRITHSLSAVGQSHFTHTTGGITGTRPKEAWEYARDWCIGRLGFDSGVLQDSGVLNLNITGVSGYELANHIRATTRSETNGSYSVNESWLAAVSGSGALLGAIEDFNVEVNQSAEDDFTQLSVNGLVQGIETISYGTGLNQFSITKTKMESAEDYWASIQTRILPRAQLYAEDAGASRTLNIIPLVKTVG